MHYRSLLFAGLLVVNGVTFGQQQSFDFDAYKTFLRANAEIGVQEMLVDHDVGPFADRLPAASAQPRYRDSVQLAYELTAFERELIDYHGFMVTERLRPESFGDAFTDIYRRDLPVFLSTDAILHAVHMSYDRILQDSELAVLSPKLEATLAALHGALPALMNTYGSDAQMRTSIGDLDVYLTVPRTLLSDAPVPTIWPENQATVDDLLSLIAAEDVSNYNLFANTCRIVDFSQFTPRGHYTQDPVLTRYFQAMIWLGRTELYLIAPNTVECKPTDADVQRQAIDAALLLDAVRSSGAETTLQEMDELIRFFVGESDNVTIENLQSVLANAGVAGAYDLRDASRFRQFQEALAAEAFAFQRINSQILFSNDITDPDAIQPSAAFMLLGQRFVIDSYVTGHVVFDEVIPEPPVPVRLLPSSQDVLFALGNDASVQFLQNELDHYDYAAHLSALRYLVDSYEQDFWNSTLYNGWLDAIRTLNPPATRDALPPFMQTAAWWQEKMNTQLASWAQLRHDNLLYAKQSYTGGITCSYPYSYVEPVPAFYDAVGRFASRGAAFFENQTGGAGWQVDYISSYFRYLEGISDTLRVVAEKELAQTPLAETELSFLSRMLRETNTCGPEIDGWYTYLFYGDKERSKLKDLVVADVHTVPTDENGTMVGWVMHVGTGPLNMAVVDAEIPGEGVISFVGPVMSYYEHVSSGFERLTDEAWQTAYAASPSFRPSFVNLYLADQTGGPMEAGFRLATGVDAVPSTTLPQSMALVQNYPNPFNSATVIGFSLSTAAANEAVVVDIFNVQGQLVRRLVDERIPAGHYTVPWDGRLDSGADAASGVYLCRLRSGDGQVATGKMTLIR